MTRRIAAGSAALAVALALAGCGGDGDGGSRSGLDDALRYLPDDAPAVVAVQTDAEGKQWKQLNELIDRFAFAGEIKDQAKRRIEGRADFDDDVEPQLGNDLVVGVPDAGAARRHPPAIVAFRTKDEGKARELLRRDRKVGEASGAEIYQQQGGKRFTAIEGAMVVSAPARDVLEAALERHDSDDQLTEEEFEDGLGELDRDAVVRATGDLQAAIEAPPKAAAARSVPWLGTVRDFAAVGYARPDGLAVDFELRTEGAAAAQLPLAPGAAAPPVPRREGEIGIAMREPARLFVFLDALRQALPRGEEYSRFQAALKEIGIDLRRDILDHLGATAALSFPLDKTFAARADLKDAAGVADALKTIAERLPGALGGDTGFRIEPGGGEGFYRMTGRDGKQVFVGVVGDRLAMGSEAARARDFAEADAEPVPGARGSVAIYGNGEEIADRIIARTAGGLAALFGRALAEPLGDLTGWAEAKPEGISGHLDLKIEDR